MLDPIQWLLAGALKLDKAALLKIGAEQARSLLKSELRRRMLAKAPGVAKKLVAGGYTVGQGQTSVRGRTAPATVHFIREAQFLLYRRVGLPALAADAIRDAHDDKIVLQVAGVSPGTTPEAVVKLVAVAEVELLF